MNTRFDLRTLMRATLTASVATLGLGAASAGATSVALTPGSGWNAFDVDNTYSQSGGLEWIDVAYNGDGSALSFTINNAAPVAITVVDAGFAGDQYHVYDNGTLIGTTSAAASSTTSIGTNFDAALASGTYSFGTYLLAAGSHTITGDLAVSAVDGTGTPYNASVGAIEVNTVPLPGSALLLMSGSGLLAVVARRRRAV